ncbi:TonB-dependent receptor [Halosquirtibacter xylanolyticus]|uniref:TonB-dependent receptor plug domain-containing protein n=1 Tax=Halosquirtibacter xylanolyticus TaxID=3374599 RepID=UPI0037496418|nr:TonB-dependent receptor [Prolixibacteraceae bacterium]
MKSTFLNSSNLIHFKRWNGKAYSAFNTLKRVVHIATLVCSYVIVTPVLDVAAQEVIKTNRESEDLLHEDIEEVMVSAKRVPVLLSDVNRSVTIIDRKEIELAPVQSIQDLLEYAMSVDIRQRGGMGVQADMSIRGGTSEQVAILINGMCINDPQTGHNTLNLPIPMDAIKRIEILNGASSVNFGVNAFSGAINIITDAEDTSNLNVQLSAGMYGFLNGTASATLSTESETHFISASHRKSDGYVDNTDFTITNLYYTNKFKFKNADLRSQLGYVDNAFGANSFYTADYPDQFEHVKTTFASVELKGKGALHLSPSVYYRNGVDHFQLFRDPVNAPEWNKDNYHRTNVFGGNLNSWFESSLGRISWGFNYRYEGILSSQLGEERDTPKTIVGVEEAKYTHSYNRNNYSFFLSDDLHWNKLDLSLSLMSVINSDLGKAFWAPGASFGYEFVENLRWMVSANSALRMPTFTDMFYSSRTNVGNKDLRPEKAWSYETGLKYHHGGLKSETTVFYRKSEDVIDWVAKKAGVDKRYYATNISEINTYGVEGSFEYNFFKSPFIKRLSLNFSFIDQDKKEIEGYDSTYALDYLKAKIDLGVRHKIYGNFIADWKVTYQDRNGTYKTSVAGQKDPVYVNYEPFIVTNLKISYEKEKFNLYGEVSNMFDKTYVDFGNIQQPGAWVRLGVKYKLSL